MNYLLTLLSICLETGKNVFLNDFSKNTLKNEADIYKFNACLYVGSAVIIMPMLKSLEWSWLLVILSLFFAIVTTLSQYFYLKALKFGSMAYSTFFTGCGLIIPTICGVVFWGENLGIFQIISLPVLIVSMAVALGAGRIKFSMRWLVYSLGALVFTGGIGVLQGVHQTSGVKEQMYEFLFLSFVFMVIANFIMYIIYDKTIEKSTYSVKSRSVVTAGISGVFMGIVNVLNLYLSGHMSKIIFFPLVNGGLIFVSLLASVIIFKERLSRVQWVGLIVGILALSMVGV